MAVVRDEYAAVVERERPLLQSCGYLLTGDEGRADRLVELVLARMYERWDHVRRPRVEALRGLVQTSPHDPQLPWDTRDRVQLVDGSFALPSVAPIVTDLSSLPRDQRAVIVLERYAELPSVQIAEIVGRTVDEVLLLARQARATLANGHPDRAVDAALADELREAVPVDRRIAYDAAADLVHGHQLVRRRWLRRGLAATAAVVLLVAAVMVLAPDPTPTPVAGPPPTAPPTSTAQRSCDPATDLVCRGEILRLWRAEMTNVVQSYVDPQGRYFSGYGYRYDHRYDSPGFWSGHGGALAFEMFRLDKGATVVYLQIATSSRFAVRCGETTGGKCHSQTFLSGDSFNLTQSATVTDGMEVQYRLTDRVITVIARNTAKGQAWQIPRGNLIALLEDPRLKLPEI
jgi:hypothetical protein